MSALDDLDFAILRALSEDATLSAGALGRQLGLSQPATWRRIKRLQEAGIIAGRKLDLDKEKLGFGVTVFLGVKLATKGRVSLYVFGDDYQRTNLDQIVGQITPSELSQYRQVKRQGSSQNIEDLDIHFPLTD